jgi:hypothetical protein
MDDEKPQPYLMPHVAESAFADLLELMADEEEFPRSYADWRALWDERRSEVEGEGYKAVFIDVLPEAFSRFCKARGWPPSWQSLGEFITVKAGR